MSFFTEYNRFVATHKADCLSAGITPRQVSILVMAECVRRNRTSEDRVCLPTQLLDRSDIYANDPDLLDLMTSEKPYLQWGDSNCDSFMITRNGVAFINENIQIFRDLLSEEKLT